MFFSVIQAQVKLSLSLSLSLSPSPSLLFFSLLFCFCFLSFCVIFGKTLSFFVSFVFVLFLANLVLRNWFCCVFC